MTNLATGVFEIFHVFECWFAFSHLRSPCTKTPRAVDHLFRHTAGGADLGGGVLFVCQVLLQGPLRQERHGVWRVVQLRLLLPEELWQL